MTVGYGWQGLQIEIQLRSRLQHQWATAVETVGTFIGDELKSNRGDQGWLRFFALMSSAIALSERTPLVPDTPTNQPEIVEEIRRCNEELEDQTAYRRSNVSLPGSGNSVASESF